MFIRIGVHTNTIQCMSKRTMTNNITGSLPIGTTILNAWNITSLNETVALENGFQNARDARAALGRLDFQELVATFALENANSVFSLLPSAARQVERLSKFENSRGKRLEKFFVSNEMIMMMCTY